MDWSEAGEWLGATAIIAALFLFPKWLSFRGRAIAGTALFLIGWTGIFSGLALGDQQFIQSEMMAWIWLGVSATAIVLGITLLMPVFFEWRRIRRRSKHRKEEWRAPHRSN
jgi:uncharacterized membrane protein YcjF (UPF0283 family)